jgi:hypothetical protein
VATVGNKIAEGGVFVGQKVVEGGKSVGDVMINNKFMQVIGPNAIKDINQKLGKIKEDVMNDIKNLKIVKGTKTRLNKYVKLKIEKMLMNYLKKLPPKIKDELKDPAMCKCM